MLTVFTMLCEYSDVEAIVMKLEVRPLALEITTSGLGISSPSVVLEKHDDCNPV